MCAIVERGALRAIFPGPSFAKATEGKLRSVVCGLWSIFLPSPLSVVCRPSSNSLPASIPVVNDGGLCLNESGGGNVNENSDC